MLTHRIVSLSFLLFLLTLVGLVGVRSPVAAQPGVNNAHRIEISSSASVNNLQLYLPLVNSGDLVGETMESPEIPSDDTLEADVEDSSGGTFDVRVTASEDDAEERSNGSMYITSSDLDLAFDRTSQQTVGIRFNGVQISPGVSITNAYIQFQVDDPSYQTSLLTLRGEAADNSAAFAPADFNITSRASTSASVAWLPTAWNSTGDAGPEQRTPNLASLIQEVVNREGWKSGNSLAIFISGNGQRTAESFDGRPAAAPLLHVEYTSLGTDAVNERPSVEAGDPQSLILPALAELSGAASDDSQVNPLLTYWRMRSGPGTVLFSNYSQTSTAASMSTPGIYVLELTANDGEFSVSDAVTVTVNPSEAGNQAPVVDAGPPRNVTLPTPALLTGLVSDDGELAPVSTSWSLQSGPAPVLFDNVNELSTAVHFSLAGEYALELRADDGEHSVSDTVTVTVNSLHTGNGPPIVDAGSDQTIILPANAILDGTVIDDGLPNGQLATNWSKISGPGAVSYVDVNAVDTVASFSDAGTYVLELRATDSEFSVTDQVTIDVRAATGEGAGVVESRVSASSDDAEEKPSGSMYITSSDLELTDNRGIQTIGMRFNQIDVPPNAIIDRAYVQFQVDEKTSITTALTIHGEAVANAATFTKAKHDISTRSTTAASVNWMPPVWTTVGEAGPEQRTPELAPIVQEIVALEGWKSGNSLVLIITGTGQRTAEAYDGVPEAAPLLHVEYHGGGGGTSNQPPTVDAGPDQNVTLPAVATLAGFISDDGLPDGQLTVAWSVQNGPGTVTFEDASAETTTATFSTPGTYILQLSGSDGEFTVGDSMSVFVNPATTGNEPPTVDAGPDQTITLPAAANLNGSVSDDGQPAGQLLIRWTMQSGPGNVIFTDDTLADTSAVFSASGTYVLELSANDGELNAVDVVTVEVNQEQEGNQPPSVSAGPDQTVLFPAGASLNGAVSDDGLPGGPLTVSWTQVSGTGTATFADPGSTQTSVSFSAPGTYELRLTVGDGEFTSADELTVTVNQQSPGNQLRVPQDYATIQAAIDAANDGDTVLVSPGTYFESLIIANKTITLASLFHTTGEGTYIDQTIIDGNGSDVIRVESSVGPETTITGLTIQNGSKGILPFASLNIVSNKFYNLSDAIDYEAGGGVCRNNVFDDNSDDAIDLDGPTAVLIEGNILRNSGDDGIEIRNQGYTGPTLKTIIRNNIIENSSADGIQIIDYPGLSDRHFRIEGNLILNSGAAGLGIMDNAETIEDFRAASMPEPVELINNTIVNSDHGVSGGDNLVALNNLIIQSTNLGMKGVDGNSAAAYNLFWGNGEDYATSNVDVATTVLADPLLDGDYRVQTGSPAIDAGVATYVWQDQTVLDLSSSDYSGSAPDIGAFESAFTGAAGR